MANLFASYLAEKIIPFQVNGAYDPEQELWIGDGISVAGTAGVTGTTTSTRDLSGTVTGTDTFYICTDTDKDEDGDLIPDTDPDTDYTGG